MGLLRCPLILVRADVARFDRWTSQTIQKCHFYLIRVANYFLNDERTASSLELDMRKFGFWLWNQFGRSEIVHVP